MSSYDQQHKIYCNALQQCGSGYENLAKFDGPLYQQGYGLGSVFASLARFASPILKFLLPHALSAAQDLATTMASTPKMERKSALKKVAKRAGAKVAQATADKLKAQSGGGKKLALVRRTTLKKYKRRKNTRKLPVLTSSIKRKIRPKHNNRVLAEDIFG